MTPRYLNLLFERSDIKRKSDQWIHEVMGGQLIAMVGNTGFKGWEEPRKPEEYMPSEWAKKKGDGATRRRSRAKIADEIGSLMGLLMRQQDGRVDS